MIDPVTLLTVGMGVGKMALGGLQSMQAAKMRKRNIRPDYEIEDEYYENLSMAETQAQSGYGQDVLKRQNDEALRGLTASLSAGLQVGVTPNQASDYYSTYLSQIGDTAVKDVQLKFQNINNLAKARESLANQKFIEFGYDKDMPYKDTAQAAAQLGAQGVGNIMGGMDTAVAGFTQGESRKLYKEQTDKLALAMQQPQPININTGNVITTNDLPQPGSTEYEIRDAMVKEYLNSTGQGNSAFWNSWDNKNSPTRPGYKIQ